MFFEKNGVKIYYKISGKGKPVIFVHGAVNDADYFNETTKILEQYYQVISYDRRGSARSTCTEDVTDFSVDAQAEDLIALIDELRFPKVVLVSISAGGEMALEAMKKRPEQISHLIAYEIPMLEVVLEERPELLDWVKMMEKLIEDGWLKQATKEFAISIPMDERAPQKDLEEKERDRKNFNHFIHHEFSYFSYYKPDLEYYTSHKEKVTAVVGDRSMDSNFAKAMELFSEKTGCELLHFPGHHNLAYDLPVDFATCLLGVLLRIGW